MTGPDVTASGHDTLPLTVVTSDRLRLVFAPTRGGRLLSLRVDGHELLWQNPALVGPDLEPALPLAEWPRSDGEMSTWANVGGSKTWPAPQGWNGDGEWPGPPDRVLDSGAFDVRVERPGDAVEVVLTSADDVRSGVRIERRFTIPARGTGFRQITTFTNVVDRPVRWSIWEVCQVDTSAGSGLSPDRAAVVVPLGMDGDVLDLGTWFGSVEEVRAGANAGGDSGTGHTTRLSVGTGVAKRGFARVPGSVSYHGPDGSTISLRQSPVAGAVYPDGGAQVEVWLQTPTPAPLAELGNLHPSADLVELELLGPLVDLEPGATTATVIDWSVAPPL